MSYNDREGGTREVSDTYSRGGGAVFALSLVAVIPSTEMELASSKNQVLKTTLAVPMSFRQGTESPGTKPSPDLLVGSGGCAGTTLYPGQALGSGGYLCSSTGGYTLIMQTDGNLVEYNSSGIPLWASDTYGEPGNYVVMQSDGNLVVYSSSGQPRWASGTYGIGGGTAYLTIQGDSNVVIYDSSGAIWAVRWFSPQTYAYEIMFHFGWSSSQWQYLDELWQKESNWQWNVCNGGTYPTCNYYSSAYGIPQALPGSKMGSVWPDWATDPFTQVTWGEQYIASVYVDPANACSHEVEHGWYGEQNV
jgi:hypothetical protein